jgi:isopentenyl diphosphate isomerase/L-lactate dehydrogenase-like FMN-dependent dehydrogenase
VPFNSGVRRGGYIVNALVSGANGVLAGRAYAYGLAAGDEAGVTTVIEGLANEVSLAMELMGMTTVAGLRAGGTG